MRQEGPSYFRLYAADQDAALVALRRQRGHLRALSLTHALEDEGWRSHQRRVSGDLDTLCAVSELDVNEAWEFLLVLAPFVKPGSFMGVVVDGRSERWTFNGSSLTVSRS